MDSDYTNTDLKPTEIRDYPFLYCCDEEIRSKYSHVDSWGKWMMFFKKEKLDEKWAAACELYHQGKLTGIASMKVSTAYDNDRASDKNTGVVIFYCGPPGDAAAMMEYGKNLLQQFPYQTRFGYMFYKSDEQTALGTRATGRTKNSLYRIPVPGGESFREYDDGSDDGSYWGRRRRKSDWWYRPGAGLGDSDEEEKTDQAQPAFVDMDPAYTNTNLKPNEVDAYPYLYCCDERVRGQYSHVNAWGKWLMFFPKEELNEKWTEACDLYRAGRLMGIAYLKVSTAFESKRASDKQTGVVAFYCGPVGDRIGMIDIGRGVLDQFPYESDFGYMYYKSEEQTARGTRSTGRQKNSLYKIAVPKKISGGLYEKEAASSGGYSGVYGGGRSVSGSACEGRDGGSSKTKEEKNSEEKEGSSSGTSVKKQKFGE